MSPLRKADELVEFCGEVEVALDSCPAPKVLGDRLMNHLEGQFTRSHANPLFLVGKDDVIVPLALSTGFTEGDLRAREIWSSSAMCSMT